MRLFLRLLILVVCGAQLTAKAPDLLRTWTSQEGQQLRAQLLDSDTSANSSRMRRDDGRIITIPWSRLSIDDQAFIQTALKNVEVSPDTPAEQTAKSTTLPRAIKLKRVPMVTQKGNFCVPASAAMIAGFHGIKTDQDQIAQLSSESSISNEGTYPSDMALAMRKLGFEGRTLHWKSEDDFIVDTLPAIQHALVDSGPIYISFKPGVFGSMGHGCVIVGYDDRHQEMHFYNPWGNEFKKEYMEVALHGYGIVLFNPPRPAPIASEAFIAEIKHSLPHFKGDFLKLANHLQQTGLDFELIWCNRRDSRDDKRFAVDTARDDGRTILELSFRRNPAVLLPISPDGKTKKYYFVTRRPEGGASFLVREIAEHGWSPESSKTLGSLTRQWPTAFNVPDQTDPIWELPMIELHSSE